MWLFKSSNSYGHQESYSGVFDPNLKWILVTISILRAFSFFFIKIVYYSNIYNLYNKNTIKQFVAKI